MDDHRREPRQPLNALGRIAIAKKSTYCRVVDVSSGGARIKTAAAEQLPDTFELEISPEDEIRASEVRWRKGNEVGVKFK